MASVSDFHRAPLVVSPNISPKGLQIRSLPDLIDWNAEKNPSWLFAIQEVCQGGKHAGLVHITFEQLKSITSKCALILARSFPKSHNQLGAARPVALALESDITLFIYLAAFLYLDIPVLLLSTRLSPVAISHLLKTTNARGVVVSQRSQPQVKEALSIQSSDEQSVNMVLCMAISYDQLQDILTDSTYNIICHGGQSDEEKAVILHSSGTTGLPKPIRLAHRYLLGYASCHHLTPSQCIRRINVTTLPMYHGFGLLAPCLSLSTGKPCCFPSASVIPSASSLVDLLEATDAASLLTVPTIIDEAISDTRFLVALTSLDFLAVGGGAIKPSVGEYLVSRGVHLLNHYGATEIGAIAPIFLPDKDYDWHYLRLRTDIGLELNTTGEVDQNGKILYHLTGYPFGWGAPFTIQDLLTRRTGSEHIEVAVLGRMDDLIVLANGEKFRPQQLESALAMQPGIKGAIVFGEHREEIGVIVEPSNPLVSAEEREEFLAAVWATIENENVTLDRHARVASKDMVILLQPNKSIPRSDKGSFMRKEADRVFEAEINDVYAGAAGSTTDGTTLSPEPGKLEQGLRAMVKRCMRDRIGTSLAWNDADDFFEMGMDSLEASRLARMLSQVNHHGQFLALREGKVLPRFIYQNPNIKALATALQSDQITHSSSTNAAEVLTNLAAKYAVSFNGQLLRAINSKTVLLTGATGHLGVYLLQQLCRDPNVKKVIAFNRRRRNQTFSERQSEINSKLGVFLTEDEWQKIHFYPSEQLGQPRFGLTESEFEVMARETTHVIHNAWPMDFELDLHSFHPRFKEMQNLVSFAARRHDWQSQAHPRRLIFISSIAVAAHHPQPILMEMPVLDATVPAQMGYAQAKWVCERVLTNAAASADPDHFEAVIIRLGQVVGSTTSAVWNAREHIPAILKASQLIGAFPDLKGTYSWIPSDIAAKSIVEILFSPKNGHVDDVHVAHIENPIRQPWRPLLIVLAEKLNLENKHEPLPLNVWLDRAVQIAGDKEELAFIHSLRFFLSTYFQKLSGGGLILDTTNARERSRTLRGCNGIGLDQLSQYIEAWREQGFLD